MKTLQWLAVGLVIGLLGTGARAEEKPDYAKLLVGKWEVAKSEEGGPPAGTMIEFTKDGKFKVTVKKGTEDATFEGTYKVEGDAFTFTMTQGGEERTRKITISKISDKEMTTKNDQGKEVELKKK